MPFGQIVLGPPGSGKTTYCDGMQQMCKALHRKQIVVNLDPANEMDNLPYETNVDIRNLICLESAMEDHKLGPNGALVFCMEYLLVNFDWLERELSNNNSDAYVLFDCPGQVELYCHYDVMKQLVVKLEKAGYRLTCVHLVDSTLCTDGYKYISALLVSLTGQILMELPHVNVLTKMDLLRKHQDDLDFQLEYYIETQDLHQLMLLLERRRPNDKALASLNAAICELVEDFNLVTFRPLDIHDKESVLKLLKEIDNANGRIFFDGS